MTAVSTTHPPTLTLAPSGPLCEDTIAGFKADLATGAGSGEVVVDLREVTIFSAAAMRVVAEARRRGTRVRLVNPSVLTARALDAVGISTS